MKYALSILNWIKGNKGLSLAIVVCAVLSAVILFRAKAKAKCEDCSPYQKIAQDLIDAFKDKGTVSSADINSGNDGYVFGDYRIIYELNTDTTKPMTAKEYDRYRDSVIRINQKKLDSLKNKKS